MKLAVSTGFCYRLPCQETLQIIAASGCRNIELLMNQTFHGLKDADIIAAIRDNGLSATSIHVFPQVWLENMPDDENDAIQRALNLQQDLRHELVVSHLVAIKNNSVFRNNDDNHKRNILYFNQTQPLPVTTENMPPGVKTAQSFLTDAAQTLEFLREHNLPMTFDTTHAAHYSPDLIAAFEYFRPHVRNIHLSDFRDGREHLIPGAGTLPLKQFVRHLKTEGYAGNLTIELDFVGPDGLHLAGQDKIAAALRQAVEYVGGLL